MTDALSEMRRAASADADTLAELHRSSFERPWDAATFEQLLSEPTTVCFVLTDAAGSEAGFVLGRVVLDEAELLGLAVCRGRRRRRIGICLLKCFLEHAAKSDVSRLFLEVSVGNAAAISLYEKAGFIEVARRRNYYGPGRMSGQPTDAIVMRVDPNFALGRL